MKKTILIAIAILVSVVLFAQDNKVTEAEFKVFGNCN